MTIQQTKQDILDQLQQLFLDAGYSVPELVNYIYQLEQQNTLLTEQLKKEKTAVRRQSGTTYARSSMNSRLKDALRE
ncbi:hypothetical protein ACFSTH_08675 [Paenibacillus yanchengensis]|uniref:Uncharacterized protein n=1 Tax=Paenibacillus yanchengensis TaxID=2035833 RepID=A0ABW4YLC1_9BACL